MTENDIKGSAMALREILSTPMRRKRELTEEEALTALTVGISLLEGFLVNIGRIADAQEAIAMNTAPNGVGV